MLSSDDTACFSFNWDPDTGRCSCGHNDDNHEGTLGGCEICAYDIADDDQRLPCGGIQPCEMCLSVGGCAVEADQALMTARPYLTTPETNATEGGERP